MVHICFFKTWGRVKFIGVGGYFLSCKTNFWFNIFGVKKYLGIKVWGRGILFSETEIPCNHARKFLEYLQLILKISGLSDCLIVCKVLLFLETFRVVWNFLVYLEVIQVEWRTSSSSRRFRSCLETFQIVCKVSRLSGNLFIYLKSLVFILG